MKAKTSTTKSRTANKISKAPTRASTRIAAKSLALQVEKNNRQDARKAGKSKSPRSPNKNLKKDVKVQETDIKKTFELNENLRDNPMTSRNNQNTFSFDKNLLDSCKCQMAFAEQFVDCYPYAIRAIENSDNDLAVRALHHIQKSRY